MTGDLLESDIELARRLLQSGEPDDRVIQALCLRRVDPVRARRAVDALNEGAEVRADNIGVPFRVEHPLRANAEASAPSPQPERVRTQPRIEAASSKAKSYSWVWFATAGLC